MVCRVRNDFACIFRMPHYRLFAGLLDSAIEFPELRPAPGGPVSWRLEIGMGGAEPPVGEPLGEDAVYGDCHVRCYRRADGGFSLDYDDTGRFDISPDGQVITWYRPQAVVEEAARADVASRVLALAMHAAGTFTLHASAVSLDGRGVAFVGPKYHGKSTLAAALVQRGARLLTDDTLPVRLSPTPMLLPGVQQLRLWGDAAARVGGAPLPSGAPRKILMTDLAEERIEANAVPFSAAYVLVPQRRDEGEVLVRRERLPAVAATMQLVQHARLAPLFRRREAGALFSQAAAVADRVPVYVLLMQRDLDRLDEAVEHIVKWHLPPARQGAA